MLWAQAALSGTVIYAVTGEPVKRGAVTLSGASAHDSPATLPDGAGKFSFAAVNPGRYRLTAEKAAFLEYRFYAFEDSDNGKGELIKLAGKETRTISLRTIAGGQ